MLNCRNNQFYTFMYYNFHNIFYILYIIYFIIYIFLFVYKFQLIENSVWSPENPPVSSVVRHDDRRP